MTPKEFWAFTKKHKDRMMDLKFTALMGTLGSKGLACTRKAFGSLQETLDHLRKDHRSLIIYHDDAGWPAL